MVFSDGTLKNIMIVMALILIGVLVISWNTTGNVDQYRLAVLMSLWVILLGVWEKNDETNNNK